MTPKQQRAAQLAAEDNLTDEAIASEVGVSRRTLAYWKNLPDFRGSVEACRKAIEEDIFREGIARRAERVRRLNERVERLDRVIAERAADPTREDIPGYRTGLMVVRRFEVVKECVEAAGDQPARTVEKAVPTEVAVDVGLLKELREHEKQAAQELGEWAEKKQVTGPDGGPIQIIEVFPSHAGGASTELAEVLPADEASPELPPGPAAGLDE